MADLTIAEQELFAKYWGRDDLAHDEDFWADIRLIYIGSKVTLPLPVEYNPRTVRRVLDMLKCPRGVCGLCCRYPTLHLAEDDIKAIIQNTKYTQEDMDKLLKTDEQGLYLGCAPDGCPFLKDNVCTIWDCRPNVCYLYPITGGRKAMLAGQELNQMTIRLHCLASINIVKKIMQMAVTENPNMMLLPDLSVVNKYQEAG
jgi:Fe-S-cluster containining protein